MTEPAVQVDDLRIRSAAGTILDGTALAVDRGERVGLVGESGSGKSTLSLALLGSVAPGLELAAGNVTVLGVPVVAEITEESRPTTSARDVTMARHHCFLMFSFNSTPSGP